MSDEDDFPELDPAEEARVRALLADLGSSGSEDLRMPDDVAARLDATLEGLAVEHAARHASDERPATGRVVPLRPRWMPKLAGAAAAVIVLGLGGFAVSHLSGSGVTSGSADSGGGGTSAGSEATPPKAGRSDTLVEGAVPLVHVATFRADVRAVLLEQRKALNNSDEAGGSARQVPRPSDASSPRSPGFSTLSRACRGPEVSDGSQVLPVRFDGRPAVLVVHPASGGHQRVEAYTCGGGRRLASTSLPARD